MQSRNGNISETVQDRDVVTKDHEKSDTWHIEQRQFRWPWVTFKVIHLLEAIASLFKWDFGTVVQQLTRF